MGVIFPSKIALNLRVQTVVLYNVGLQVLSYWKRSSRRLVSDIGDARAYWGRPLRLQSRGDPYIMARLRTSVWRMICVSIGVIEYLWATNIGVVKKLLE